MVKVMNTAVLAWVASATGFVVHEPQTVPSGWVPSNAAADLDERMEVRVGLPRSNQQQLDDTFWEVSTPGRPGYLKHVSWEDMGKMVRASDETLGKVAGFMASHGATAINVAPHGDYVTASLKLRDLEAATSGTFRMFEHETTGQKLVRLTGGVKLPTALSGHVETFTGLHGFPLHYSAPKGSQGAVAVTPDVINAKYSITKVGKSGKDNKMAIGQFQGQYVSPTDLTNFCKKYNKGNDCSIDKFVGNNVGTRPGVESMLDVEYMQGIGQDITTWVYSYPNYDFCADLLTWASDVSSESDRPHVVSLSYGTQYAGYCDKATTARLSQDVQKLATMGITTIIASGDDGSGGMSRQGSNKGKLVPSFPASIPYVLAVGSTGLPNGVSGAEAATTQFGSGGGFSYDYEMPEYQSAQVKAYLAKNPKTGTGTYASQGRATPDVSLLGEGFEVIANGNEFPVGGTSASTPTWGGIIALLNEVCLSASSGAKTLGFVNPLFYQNPAAFTDITVGSNAVGENRASGWKCEEGWDAATGLGTPKFDKLAEVVKEACSGSSVVV